MDDYSGTLKLIESDKLKVQLLRLFPREAWADWISLSNVDLKKKPKTELWSWQLVQARLASLTIYLQQNFVYHT